MTEEAIFRMFYANDERIIPLRLINGAVGKIPLY